MVCEDSLVYEPACSINGSSPGSEEVLAMRCRESGDSSHYGDWEQGWAGSVK